MGLVLLLSLGVSACSFQFSYQSISAPLGTVGDVGIQVQKTHNNCVLSSMDEYLIEGRGVQILGETVWEDLGGGLYEKWVQLSLATLGDGSLTISKTCIKDGYEEKVLPILTQSAEAADAVWMLAWNGTYPFEATGHPECCRHSRPCRRCADRGIGLCRAACRRRTATESSQLSAPVYASNQWRRLSLVVGW